MPVTINGDGTITGAFDVVTAGTVAYFGMTTPPTGWVKANGAALSRTTYSALFAKVGTVFGAGDGSTTFNVPDLRGEFPRGWDDGRGIDAGRAFGTAQAEGFASHTHGSGWYTTNNEAAGQGTATSATFTNRVAVTNTPGNATTATGGTETRPRNIALLACIKF